MNQLLDYLKKNPLVLAPMAGVTDYPFRSFMKEMNCGILTTELVSAVALVREDENSKTHRIAHISSEQQPIGIQIFGEDPQMMAEAALRVEQMGASFVDLNLGCPVPKIVKKGAGSALLKDLKLLSQVLKAIRKKISIPLTIKIRTGWSENHRNSLEVVRLAEGEGCLWVTIHGRTRSQGYSGLADWDYIGEVKSQTSLPIIGNGDLVCPKQIQKVYKQTGCDGLMIGRGALRNPWIFNEAYYLMYGRPLEPRDYLKVLKQLYFHLDQFHHDRMTLIQFKKFVSWFSGGYPESTQFRKAIFQLQDKAQLMEMALQYFHRWTDNQRNSQPYEAFLLQGHG